MTSRFVSGIAAALLLCATGPGAQASDSYRLVHSFAGAPGGYNPGPVVVRPTGAQPGGWALFGTTQGGGLRSAGSCGSTYNGGCGIAYRLDPPVPGGLHWTETRLYLFKGAADGNGPTGRLAFDGAGSAYGVTEFGGSHGCGTVFRLSPPGSGQYFWNKRILHDFGCGSSGLLPFSGVVLDGSGALYGTAPTDDLAGLVYRLAPAADAAGPWSFQVLHRFGGVQGADALAPLTIDASGTLYGTVSNGFVGTSRGSVFKLTPPASPGGTWVHTTLHTFPDVQGGLYGSRSALIRDQAGALFGTSDYGGANEAGGVFRLLPPASGQTAWRFSILHEFNGQDGTTPGGLAFLDGSGALYGSTANSLSVDGTTRLDGLLFKLTPPSPGRTRWTETVPKAFNTSDNRIFGEPAAPMVLAPDGLAYGTRLEGGTAALGSAFSLRP